MTNPQYTTADREVSPADLAVKMGVGCFNCKQFWWIQPSQIPITKTNDSVRPTGPTLRYTHLYHISYISGSNIISPVTIHRTSHSVVMQDATRIVEYLLFAIWCPNMSFDSPPLKLSTSDRSMCCALKRGSRKQLLMSIGCRARHLIIWSCPSRMDKPKG